MANSRRQRKVSSKGRAIRTTLAIGSGLSLAAAGGGLAGASPGTSHSTASSATTTESTVGTSTGQASTGDPLAEFQTQLFQEFPTNYAGMFENPDETYSVVVVGTDPALESKAQSLFDQIPSQFGVAVPAAKLKLTFVSASHTLSSLYSIKDQAVAKMLSPAAGGGSSGIISVGLDEEHNQVVVTTDGSTTGQSAAAALSTAYGATIHIETTSVPLTFKTGRESDTPPWNSGDQIVSEISSTPPRYATCTLGFGVHNRSTGQVYSLTAGHCGSRPWYNTTHYSPSKNTSDKVGSTSNISFPTAGGTGMDTQLIADSSSILMWQGPVGGAYRTTITGAANPMMGSSVCNEGSNGGEQCGTVTITNTTALFAFPTRSGTYKITNLFKDSAASAGGDSGGPILYPSSFGPLAGGAIEGGTTYGEQIDTILYVWSVALGGSFVVNSSLTP